MTSEKTKLWDALTFWRLHASNEQRNRYCDRKGLSWPEFDRLYQSVLEKHEAIVEEMRDE